MRVHRRVLAGGAALLAGAAIALPAVAGSETAPTIEAVNVGGGIYGEEHHWSPAQATIAAGASVTLSNPTEVKHGVYWVGGPAIPSCSGVPVGSTEAASGTKWSGTCTFTKAGVYTFYCTVHGAAMTAKVTVNSEGATTTTTTPPPGTGGSTTTGSLPTGEPGQGTSPGSPGALGSPLLGSAARAIRLFPGAHGGTVHGSISISTAGANGRLEVDLLVRRALLSGTGHAGLVRVGRLLHPSLLSGSVPFSVALSGRAKSALRRHHELGVTVKITVTAVGAPAVTVLRRLTLRR